MDVGPAGAAHPAEEAPRRWGPGEWPGEWPGTARPEWPWEARVEPALTLRGGRGGHLEVGKVSGAKPLCRPRQKRDPGRRGPGVTPRGAAFCFVFFFPSPLDASDLAHLDSRCRTVSIAQRRAVCLSPEEELQVSSA